MGMCQEPSLEVALFRMENKVTIHGVNDEFQDDHDEWQLIFAVHIMEHGTYDSPTSSPCTESSSLRFFTTDLAEKELGLMKNAVSELLDRLDTKRRIAILNFPLVQGSRSKWYNPLGVVRFLYFVLVARNGTSSGISMAMQWY